MIVLTAEELVLHCSFLLLLLLLLLGGIKILRFKPVLCATVSCSRQTMLLIALTTERPCLLSCMIAGEICTTRTCVDFFPWPTGVLYVVTDG